MKIIGTLFSALSLCLIPALATAQTLEAEGLARANQGPDLKFPEEARA
jgi:hypothetical protein